jgi:hypothetical protein|tara:strand:- start:309 stop:650 length:342 start_codon:yes stop_codon:yes gene_type:complete
MWMGVYLVFGLYWMTAYLDYQCQFVIMVATCSYYFNSTKKKEGSAQVLLGFKSGFYHCGSIAFGSFFVAIVQTATTFMGYLKYFGLAVGTASKASTGGGGCLSFIWDESTLTY